MKRGVFGWSSVYRKDASLSVLLVVQSLVTFVAIPLGASMGGNLWMLDLSTLAFAAVCAVTLTERIGVRVLLVVSIAALAFAPGLWTNDGPDSALGATAVHSLAAMVAFGFGLIVTALVARVAFSSGPVTMHRIRGAVLVYLNVAVLFGIVYDLMYIVYPGSLHYSAGGSISPVAGVRLSDLSYFSLTTISTAGFGDIVPVHPVARGLANLESLFGQLYPAIVLSRLVSLNLVHSAAADAPRREAGGEATERLGDPKSASIARRRRPPASGRSTSARRRRSQSSGTPASRA
jgi:hypothetical protein